jgi:hypothetical protein
LADYLLRRRNPDGGFCYYSLDESNLNDTSYAVLILDLLGGLPQDKKTIDYIRAFQSEDGSFFSPFSAWCVLTTLKVMNVEPEFNPGGYALHLLRERGIRDNVYIERLSIFESSYYLASILTLVGRPELCGIIAKNVLEYRLPDGTFGRGDSSIISTYHALSVLKMAGKPMGNFTDTASYVLSCAVESGGFTKKPLTGLAFMDETYFAVMTLDLLGKRPEHLRETIGFISDCQNDNGGFRRARASGISGFETSYYAVESLRTLIQAQDALKK